MKTHKTESVEIDGQDVEIDCLMVGLIKWMNEFSSVKTFFCCEGEKGIEQIHQPYAIFKCEDDEDLRAILRVVQAPGSDKLRKLFDLSFREFTNADQYNFAKCEIEMDTVSKTYRLQFRDKGNLVKFNEYMEFNTPTVVYSIKEVK